MRVIRWAGALLVLIAAIIATAWAFGAVWFDAPFGNGNKVAAALLADHLRGRPSYSLGHSGESWSSLSSSLRECSPGG